MTRAKRNATQTPAPQTDVLVEPDPTPVEATEPQPAPAGEAVEQPATPAPETPKTITITVSILGRGNQTVTGKPGMTVAEALRRAEVDVDRKVPVIRGAAVKLTQVLNDKDTVIVSARVRGGNLTI